MGFAELALTTGEAKYATAYSQVLSLSLSPSLPLSLSLCLHSAGYSQIWWNLCQLERHTNGAMMAGERWVSS